MSRFDDPKEIAYCDNVWGRGNWVVCYEDHKVTDQDGNPINPCAHHKDYHRSEFVLNA